MSFGTDSLDPRGDAPRTMPTFGKSPAELVDRFTLTAARHPGGHQRPMFGYPALFRGGNDACGPLPAKG